MVDRGTQPVGPRDPSSDAALVVTQSVRKKQAITEAATALFLAQGFQSTSMDEIAAMAKVSKQTVYKHFTDKQRLLRDIVLSITGRAGTIARTLGATFDSIGDVETGLPDVAQRYALAVLHPDVLRLRRLVVCEAARFPDLAQTYYERAPQVGLESVEAGLGSLVERGLLRIEDLGTAANQFAYLILGPLIDKALFQPEEAITEKEIVHWAKAGATAFVKAYGVTPDPRPSRQRSDTMQ
jgi:TetR/AcrR family transcriptional repressor of mexJK operon